jgi:two-component system, cell cycle response regulator CpdR
MIFVVDDDAGVLRSIALYLEPHCEVETFLRGSEALERLRCRRPDMLLSDLDLGGVRGEDVALAAARLDPPPRIAFMSGDPDRLAEAQSLAQAVFLKPFDLADLLTFVKA